jgi:BirA family biotin operon repressor/biotin-[acetyl-CoA-carboxylase] ligase
LITLEKVDSTNAEARRRAEAGAAEGTLIRAVRQTAGRGRRGRRWASPPGNLYLSLILRPELPLCEAALMTFLAALALGDALAESVPPMTDISLKWPNDVLVNLRKVAGILLESSLRADGRLDWLVIGVGVNVAHFPEDADYPATSLHFEGAEAVTVDQVMAAFARHFLRWSDDWRHRGFAPAREAWLARATGVGGEVRVRLGSESFTGRFLDLDPSGALLVELEGGARRQVTAGDVFPVS